MRYVNIKITREGATHEQKAELIARVADLLVRVLAKNPATPSSSSTRWIWKTGASAACRTMWSSLRNYRTPQPVRS
jgi:hypothetical protein